MWHIITRMLRGDVQQLSEPAWTMEFREIVTMGKGGVPIVKVGC
jgi:hypothetical protein